MAGKLSPTAQQQLAVLESFTVGVGRLHALVEQYAAAKTGQEAINATLKREANRLKLKLMGVGLDTMSQLCGAIELAAARHVQPAQKMRTLRENVGSLKFQLEFAQRTLVRDDQEAQAKKSTEKTASE